MDIIQLLFGTDKREIWQDFSASSNGEFIDGGFWGNDKLKFQYKNWTIVFDTLTKKVGNSSRSHTRSQVVYKKKKDFYFIIYPEKYFGFLKWLVDAPTVITQLEDIDDRFIVKADKDHILREFLADRSIRNLLNSISVFSFRTTEFEPFSETLNNRNYKILSLETTGENGSVHHLQSLLTLNKITLSKLSTMDLICTEKPEMELF